MGLFGDQDASEISDNPFYVEPNIYTCVLTQLELRHNEQKETNTLLMQWTIEDEGDFEGFNQSEWIRVYLSADDRDGVEPRMIKMDQARLKARLTAIGMSEEEMNNLVDEDGQMDSDLAEQYVGTVAQVELVEKADKNDPDIKYVNIKKVTSLVDA